MTYSNKFLLIQGFYLLMILVCLLLPLMTDSVSELKSGDIAGGAYLLSGFLWFIYGRNNVY